MANQNRSNRLGKLEWGPQPVEPDYPSQPDPKKENQGKKKKKGSIRR
ncbi:MAG: hypothetical protein ABIA04_03580 [Pseudomonadota bacterium]